jgi:hypothetical protein
VRYFSFNEPVWSDELDENGYRKLLDNEVVTVSEEDIRRDYFPQWEAAVIAKFGEEQYRTTYGFQDCVDDFVVVNWAWEWEVNDDG